MNYRYIIPFFILGLFLLINSCNISPKRNIHRNNCIFLNVGYGLKCNCTYKMDCTNKTLLTVCDAKTVASITIDETICDSIDIYVEKILSFTGGRKMIDYDQITDGLIFSLTLYKNQEETEIIFQGINNLKEVNPAAYELQQFMWELGKKKACPPSPLPTTPS